jgi:hypothetical protein
MILMGYDFGPLGRVGIISQQLPPNSFCTT